MTVYRFAIASPILGLCSIALTLLVWAWIKAQPPGALHDQGGMIVSLVCFPLCMLGWLTAGGPAVVLGMVALFHATSHEPQPATRCCALIGVTTGGIALALALATLMIA